MLAKSWLCGSAVFLAMAVAGALSTRAQTRVTTNSAAPVATASNSSTGILVLAHGGSKAWNSNVQAIAKDVNDTEPTEVAFGMADRASMQAAIDKLSARGVKNIIAVPLFVSSHSSVIEATRYLLGLRAGAPADLMDFTMDHGHGDTPTSLADKAAAEKLKSTPVTHEASLRMSPALDHHPILADILAARAKALSKQPPQEVVVLVAHGPNEDAENKLWLADLNVVASLIAAKINFARVEGTTVRDDAENPVREQATQDLRSIVRGANDQGLRVLIVPVLLSYGGIEDGIRKRLDGLDHVMSPEGLLPDPRIADWVKESAK